MNDISRAHPVSIEKQRPGAPSAPQTARRTIDGAALFEGRTEIDIRFGQATYHLRITRQGKLILNK